MTDPPGNLVDVWRYITWLDRAAYSATSGDPLIPGPIFAGLSAPQKSLAHWLCYTMDAQTDYRRVWWFAAPIIAELVRAYARVDHAPLDVLGSFLCNAGATNKVPRLSAKRQISQDIGELTFTPRYPAMLFSIATTMVTLDQNNRSLTTFLARHKVFLSCERNEISGRVAFLLYLLTYHNIPNRCAPPVSEAFRSSVRCHSRRVLSILASPEKLDVEYRHWRQHSRRFHKRLWAALRDYLKEGHEFHTHFLKALEASGLQHLSEVIQNHQEAILAGLEVPGDVWNLLFFRRIFFNADLGRRIDPRQLRRWFDRLLADKKLPEHASIERFDVSFRYSPRMCDERRQGSCIFREASDVWGYCPPRRGIEWRGSPCPVTDHLCGIAHSCEPEACPVLHGVPSDLCQSGCRVRLQERAIVAADR